MTIFPETEADNYEVAERCSGGCCRSFPISIDYQATAVEVLKMLREEVPGKPGTMWDEWDIIADMLIPIFGPWPNIHASQAHFTCRHFDGDNCGIYESRPKLCRRYGVMTRCEYEGCTMRVKDPPYQRISPDEKMAEQRIP